MFWMYLLISGFCQECMEMRKGAPAGRPGMKQVTVGRKCVLFCDGWDSKFHWVSSDDSYDSGQQRNENEVRRDEEALPTWVLNDMARRLELLQRNLTLLREDEDIPILETHFGYMSTDAAGTGFSQSQQNSNGCNNSKPQRKVYTEDADFEVGKKANVK
jgi:hypothetical protein